MRAEIISIGDELLIGQTINTNASWMGKELSQLGISIKICTTISDDKSEILSAIEVALNGTRQVYVTKLDKFLSTEGVYKQWRNSFAIFNIVTDSMSRKACRDIPEEYLKYLFEFNVQTNTLYRGDMVEPLLVPVSSYLRTPPSPGKK